MNLGEWMDGYASSSLFSVMVIILPVTLQNAPYAPRYSKNTVTQGGVGMVSVVFRLYFYK